MIHHHTEEATLNMRELQRLDAWYRAFLADKYAVIEPMDIVLEAKISYMRNELEARQAAVAVALRERAVKQHVGVERRSRAAAPVAPRRIVRPVAVAAH